jgi:hypothetical protein
MSLQCSLMNMLMNRGMPLFFVSSNREQHRNLVVENQSLLITEWRNLVNPCLSVTINYCKNKQIYERNQA